MARVIGTVKSIHGKAAVKTADDKLIILKVGDTLHENEMVYALGADSKVALNLEGGRTLHLNGYDEILLDSSVFTALEKGESLDVDALRQAIADGLDQGKEGETAAGNEVVSESNAGADFAVRNDGRGDVSSYLTGTESSPFGVTLEPDSLGVQNIAPIALDDAGAAIEEGSGEDYDAPVMATGNVLENDTDDQLPTPADLDVTAITSNDTANAAVLADGNLSIIGKYGTLVINGETGAYTYTVDEGNHDVDAMNVGDSVTESFNYTVSDGSLTDVGLLTLTINGSNDAPVAVSDYGYAKESGFNQEAVSAEGNVITDSESGDHDVDNENIWVVGVQNVEGEENDEGEYRTQENEETSESDFVINGQYGVLYMWENGRYEYILDNENEEVDGLNAQDHLEETFSYTLTDGDKYATATLTIGIEGTNDAPIAHPDDIEISENWFGIFSIDALQNDTDVDSGDNPSNFKLLSVSVSGGFGNGIAWIDPHTNMIKYIPNWPGNQSLNEDDLKAVTLNYTMQDDSGATSESTVTVTIIGMNDHPIATVDFARGDENHTFVMNVLTNDWDVDSRDNPSNFRLTNISYDGPGTASIVANQLQFEPGTAFDYLSDGEKAYVKIWYQMEDDSGAKSNWSYAKLTLIGSNDGPVAVDDFAVADFDTYSIQLGGNAGWAGATITAIGGTLDINSGNGKLGVYGGPGDAKDVDNKGTNEGIKFVFSNMLQHAEVTLSSFNTAHGDNDTATWKAMLGTSLIASGTYSGGPNPTLVIDTGTLVFDTLIIGTPEGEQSDFYIDSISGHGLDINSDLTVVENSPLLIPESYMIANDSDVEGDLLNIVDIDTNGTIGEVSIDASGNVTYDPAGRFDHLAAGELATDTFTYVLSDGDLTDTATVTVNIIGSSSSADNSCEVDLKDILKSSFQDYNAEAGYDTIIIKGGSSSAIDFEKISSQLDNIEHLDLKDGDGAKTINNITPENVADMTDADNYLRISGDSTDTVTLQDFLQDTAASENLDGYDAYVGNFSGSEVILHIDTDISVNIIP